MKATNNTISKEKEVACILEMSADVQGFLDGTVADKELKDYFEKLKNNFVSLFSCPNSPITKTTIECSLPGYLLYQLLMDEGLDPWRIAAEPEYDRFDSLIKFKSFLMYAKKHKELFRSIVDFDLYKDNVEHYYFDEFSKDQRLKFQIKSADDQPKCGLVGAICRKMNKDTNDTHDAVDQQVEYPKRSRYLQKENFDLAAETIDELLLPLQEMTKDMKETIKNEMGVDISCIMDSLEKVQASIKNNNVKSAKKLIDTLAGDIKMSINDFVDAVKGRINDCLDGRDPISRDKKDKELSIKEQVENIFASKGFKVRYDTDGESNKAGLQRMGAIRESDNKEWDFILDDQGNFCNVIPKLFVIDNKQIMFAIRINVLEKYLDELNKGTDVKVIMGDKQIPKTVTQRYLNLYTRYKINLFDKAIIKEHQKLYALAKSQEWSSYLMTTNDKPDDSPERNLTAVIDNGGKVNISTSDNRLLFTIETINNKDVIKVAPSMGTPNPIVAGSPIDADTLMAMIIK